MRHVRGSRRAALAALALLVAACGGRDPRPDVLLVSIDTLRADVCGRFGGEPGVTPVLDDLADKGTVFLDASSVTPLTLPAHASLLTGLRPARHGLTVNGVAVPSLGAPSLARTLGAAGWRTAAFVSSTVLDRRHGLDEGFEHYDDGLAHPGGPPRPLERPAAHTVGAALEWLGAHDDPAFTWVHLYDPHAPYAAPGGRAGDDRQAYLDEVRHADRWLGRLVEGARRPERPLLVIVTSDHGEGLGEHGESTHGVLIHQATMRVPLVMTLLGAEDDSERFPGRGDVRRDVVSLLDVVPTLLEILGLPATPGLDGVSLASPPDPDRVVPLECRSPWFYYGFAPLVGARRGSLKVVGAPGAGNPDWRLFDLSRDPAELGGEPGAGHPLQARVLSPEPEQEGTAVLDRERLAALGYLGVEGREAGGPLLDARRSMGLIDAIDAANTLLVEGSPDQAYATLQAVDAAFDQVPELVFFKGKALRALGRLDEARDAVLAARALQPSVTGFLLELARIELERARRDGVEPRAAAEALEQALAELPGDPEALTLQVAVELDSGRLTEALALVEAALEERPEHVELLFLRWRALGMLGRGDEAEEVAAVIRRLAPSVPLERQP